MDLFLNYGFAWISMLLMFILSIVYAIRKFIIRTKGKLSYLVKLNRTLRKHHKLIGIALIVTGLIHGYFSFDKVLSVNFGTAAWAVSILLGLNWMARKNLSKYKGWMFYHRILTMTFFLILILHIVQAGGIQVHKVLLGAVTSPGEKFSVSNLNKTMHGASFKDGKYTGEAYGYRPGLKVSVEIKNNSITSIEILQHNEVRQKYYQRAIDSIPQAILDSQSTQVDTVSGATFTSIGIINAVNDALSKALISGSLPSAKQLPENRGHSRDSSHDLGEKFPEDNPHR